MAVQRVKHREKVLLIVLNYKCGQEKNAQTLLMAMLIWCVLILNTLLITFMRVIVFSQIDHLHENGCSYV